MHKMVKGRILLFIMGFVVAISLNVSAAEQPQYAGQDTAILRVVVDNRPVTLSVSPMLINQTPYLALRSVCDLFGANVSWNKDTGTAAVEYKKKTHTVTGLIRNDRLMVDLDSIKLLFGVNAAYNPELNVISLYRGALPKHQKLLTLLPKYENYNREDLYWLSRIVSAEAKGESYSSQLAVANVILNRMNNPSYPDTIKGVIFDKKFGVQFTPTANGSIYKEPDTLSYLAALDALEGQNNAPDALFFMNPKYATSFWMQNNREYAFTIGGHNYYY